MLYREGDPEYEKQKEHWDEIEDLVLLYQKQFKDDCLKSDIKIAKEAGDKLIQKLSPYLYKYIKLFSTGLIPWRDMEIKSFISIFMQNPDLRRALNRVKTLPTDRATIYGIFNNQIKELYYKNNIEDVKTDVMSSLLRLAKRYVPKGKNFCSYMCVSFKFEYARLIKETIKDPCFNSTTNIKYEENPVENELFHYSITKDNYHETEDGTPNDTWLSGETCSDEFAMLTPLERQIVIKYYSEEWKDGQIADFLGLHTNTINTKRRKAVAKIANHLNIDMNLTKRIRRSGMSVIMPAKHD